MIAICVAWLVKLFRPAVIAEFYRPPGR